MWQRLYKIFKENKVIILILAAGFAYRVYGIYFDYPFGVNSLWDETCSMRYLMELLTSKSFLVARGPYPLLMPFLYFPILAMRVIYLMIVNQITSVSDLYHFLSTGGMGHIYIISRWYSVFFGTATILVLYLISRHIFKNKLSGYLAAAAYAVSILPVSLAHWGKVHVPMVFFLLMSLFFALRYEEKKQLKFFYFSVISSALAMSVHVLGFSSIIFPILAYVFNFREIKFIKLIKSFLLGIFILMLFYLPNFNGIMAMYQTDSSKISSNGFMGMFPTEKYERFYYILKNSFFIEPVFIAFFIIILILYGRSIWKNILTRYVLIGLIFNYVLMSTIFSAPYITRFLLTFLTLAIILSAGKLGELFSKINAKPIVISLSMLILVLPGALFSLKSDLLLGNYTRNGLVEWMKKEMESDEFAYSFDTYVDAPLSNSAIKWHVENNEITTSKKFNYILDNPDKFKTNGINLLYDNAKKRFKELGGPNTKYIIITYFENGEQNKHYYIDTRKDSYEEIKNIRMFHDLKLVKVFYPTNDPKKIESGMDDYLNNPSNFMNLWYMNAIGPFIEVYEVLN
jgi:hypothetical protein